MKKNKLILFFFIIFNFYKIYSQIFEDEVRTTLVILEERENDKFLEDSTPFTEGVFEALWEKQYVFFDLKITEPLNFVYNQLDIRPFIRITEQSGADSLLLIKFNYKTISDNFKLKIIIDEVFFNLYSINEMKSLKVGRTKLNIDKYIDINKKISFLKKIGYDILCEIYQ